jgi:hypothetical protein
MTDDRLLKLETLLERGHLGESSAKTVRRWVSRGVKVDGGAVRLRAVKLGGLWHSTESWAREFREALTPTIEGAQPVEWEADKAEMRRAV